MTKAKGRPSKYSKKLGDKICSFIIEGYSLRQIENEDGMPSKTTICRWLASGNETFRDQYARAREAQTEIMQDEILEIADDGSNDWMKREIKGGLEVDVANAEHISRSRLRIDARKWLMGKMKPKKYGDRTILAGDKENPIAIVPTLNIFDMRPDEPDRSED
ncbi:MAG: terminase small subunit protein [Hyphomicrobiales bacterium]